VVLVVLGAAIKSGRRNLRYRRAGYVIAENAATIVVLFIGLVFPFTDLATIAIRYVILLMAVHDGVYVSATCPTFSSNSDNTGVMDVVPPQINQSLAGRSGFDNLAITIRVVASHIPDGMLSFSPPNEPWQDTIDTLQYVYANEITAQADLAPLVYFNAPFLPVIQGLSAPLHVQISGKEVPENPKAVNQ